MDPLKLENQLCFPLYAASRGVVRLYTPLLSKLGLTYTQYITMMVLWEKKHTTVKALGDLLYLDSGTLTPLLKKLEQQGLLLRKRDPEDERCLLVTITDKGEALRQQAVDIPQRMGECVNLTQPDAETLYRLLYQLLEHMK